jgi:hypothetical protein
VDGLFLFSFVLFCDELLWEIALLCVLFIEVDIVFEFVFKFVSIVKIGDVIIERGFFLCDFEFLFCCLFEFAIDGDTFFFLVLLLHFYPFYYYIEIWTFIIFILILLFFN